MKKILIIGVILFIIGFVFAEQFIVVKNKEDVPSPINPDYIKSVRDCNKIDLINRNSVSYNSKALIDGSLKECDK